MSVPFQHPGRIPAPGLIVVSAARRRHMDRGAEDLSLWITDTLEAGLLHLPEHPDLIERMAQRMVESQLGAIGKRLRIGLGLFDGSGDWTGYWMNLLGQLKQFLDLYRRIDELPVLLSYDVWQFAGVYLKKKDVLNGKAVRDRWVVVGTEIHPEERLLARRVWLFGLEKRVWAHLVDFGMNVRALDPVPGVGQVWDAVLCYYPSATGHRAIIVHSERYQYWQGGEMGFSSWDAFQEYRFQRLLKNPLEDRFPCMIQEVAIAIDGEVWALLDHAGKTMPFSSGLKSPDHWKAIGANGPVTVFGEQDTQGFRVWSVYTQDRLIDCNG